MEARKFAGCRRRKANKSERSLDHLWSVGHQKVRGLTACCCFIISRQHATPASLPHTANNPIKHMPQKSEARGVAVYSSPTFVGGLTDCNCFIMSQQHVAPASLPRTAINPIKHMPQKSEASGVAVYSSPTFVGGLTDCNCFIISRQHRHLHLSHARPTTP